MLHAVLLHNCSALVITILGGQTKRAMSMRKSNDAALRLGSGFCCAAESSPFAPRKLGAPLGADLLIRATCSPRMRSLTLTHSLFFFFAAATSVIRGISH